MEDLNKITSTRVGDNIHFFVNGAEDKGTVVKMDSQFVTVVKDDGNFQDIHINDTFFIKDIIVNKSWNDMTMEERTVELHKVHAYSPRFLGKAWEDLPQSLKDVMLEKDGSPKDLKEDEYINPSNKPMSEKRRKETSQTNSILTPNDFQQESTRARSGGVYSSGRIRQAHGDKPSFVPKQGEPLFEGVETGKSPKDLGKSNVEQGHLGGGGRSSQVVETSTAFDAEEDYEGESHDTKEEQFKHDNEKPEVTNKTMQEQLWEEWLNKESHSVGDGGSPAKTSSNNSAQTNDSGMYNPVYGDKGRHGGQGKDKEDEDKEEEKERKG